MPENQFDTIDQTQLNTQTDSEAIVEIESFSNVDYLLSKARRAAAVFTQYSQEMVDKIVYAVAKEAIKYSKECAKLAAEETRMGLYEDKILKNIVASELLYYQIKDKKTVGVIKEIKEDQMVEVAEPIGVIAALTPVTNPTSTVICKSIIALKTRNAIVFSPHLMSSKCVAYTAEILYKAALEAGAPEGCIGWLKRNLRLRKQTHYLMEHKEVDLIFATGGTSMVKVAYSTGKPAIGVGSGNTPVYMHKSCKISSAVMDICISKTFDNGTECPSEQTIVIDKEIYDVTIEEFKKIKCHVCTKEEIKKLTPVVIDIDTDAMNYKFVGKEAYKIANEAGIKIPEDTKILICEITSKNHPLLKEKLMPVLAVCKAESETDALNKCLQVNYNGGTGHTAGVFAEDENIISRFQNLINSGRVIVNQPTSLGGLGGVYNNLSTTLSFGCGTGGGNSTTENVNIYNLLNIKRVPRRQIIPMTFKTPEKIYFDKGSIDILRELDSKSVFILCSKSIKRSGLLDKVISVLPNKIRYSVFSEVEAEPSLELVLKTISHAKDLDIDCFIGLGGGSVIDTAKAVRLFYEHPDLKLDDLTTDFVDFRKRAVDFPKCSKTKLIAIPTTSGTGSEVSPALVINDKKNNQKISLIDFSLIPNTAIVDSDLVDNLPEEIAANTGIDAFTHAIEAYVSVYSSEYTDGLALEALQLIFENLPEIILNPENKEARQKMHNAATLAGMAFSNASVGINHALAHALGARFNIPHGKANAVFLLSTIDFNSGVPRKFLPFSNYRKYIAHEKYAQLAKFLGCLGTETEELIAALKSKVKDLLHKSKLPHRVSELEIKLDNYLDIIPELANKAFNDISLRTNPRTPLVEELIKVFRGAY